MPGVLRTLSIALLVVLLATSAFAESASARREMAWRNMLALNGVALAGLTAYGFAFWEYGDRSAHAKSEGWFGRGTDSGGADKLGHMYTSYLAGRGFAEVARRWGYDRRSAALAGALSSFAFTTAMEIGDSYSDFGFSYEDFISNTVGCGLAFLLADNPELDELIDIRLEIHPQQSPKSDLVTDYENMRFIAALKFSGIERLRATPLKYFEFLTGYYTRSFDERERRTPRRYLFVGVGLNLSALFEGRRWAGAFNYMQVPYIYAPATHVF